MATIATKYAGTTSLPSGRVTRRPGIAGSTGRIRRALACAATAFAIGAVWYVAFVIGVSHTTPPAARDTAPHTASK